MLRLTDDLSLFPTLLRAAKHGFFATHAKVRPADYQLSQARMAFDEAVAEDRARSDGVASHGRSLSTVSCVIATNHAPCHRAQQLCDLQGALDHNGPPPRGTPLPNEVDMRWLSRWLLELRLHTL